MDIPPYPLYNRTYALYRLSPLHHGDAPLLADRALRTHAKRLQEQLKGDTVRGVQVDFAAVDDTARLGPLEECTWELLGSEDDWIDHHVRALEDPDAAQQPPPTELRGIQVSLEYEKQSYNALLLRDPNTTTSAPPAFTALPLLLVKMPSPIRDIFLQYLRTAFDVHIAPLRLPSSFITSSIETYFRHLTSSSSTQTILETIRQLSIQLSFPATTTSLKHIDITIAASDVPRFVAAGKHTPTTPFTTALSAYLSTHLALSLSHPKTALSRIACASFTLGTDRLKLAAPDTLAEGSLSQGSTGGAPQDASAGQQAAEEFVTSLIREAAGSGKFLSGDELMMGAGARGGTPSSSEGTVRRKRAGSKARGVGREKRSRAVVDVDDGEADELV